MLRSQFETLLLENQYDDEYDWIRMKRVNERRARDADQARKMAKLVTREHRSKGTL